MYFALYSDERGVRVWIFIAGQVSVNLSWSVGQFAGVVGLRDKLGFHKTMKTVQQIKKNRNSLFIFRVKIYFFQP